VLNRSLSRTLRHSQDVQWGERSLGAELVRSSGVLDRSGVLCSGWKCDIGWRIRQECGLRLLSHPALCIHAFLYAMLLEPVPGDLQVQLFNVTEGNEWESVLIPEPVTTGP
jgi:hypothetical protein